MKLLPAPLLFLALLAGLVFACDCLDEPVSHAAVVKEEPVHANELRVRVLDPKSKPLADVEITLTSCDSRELEQSGGESQPFELGPKRTDADGRTSFASVPPREKYTLVCVHPDYARLEEPSIAIEPEGVFEEPAITMHAGATLQGLVTDEQGEPVPDALLFLEGTLFPGEATPDPVRARTDDKGFYSMRRIPSGTNRRLSASAPGFGTLSKRAFDIEKDQGLKRDFVLPVAEQLHGRVLGPGRTPIVGARVLAVGMQPTRQTDRDETRTDETGEFRFESLAPGEYNVVANLRGWRIPALTHVKTDTAENLLEGTREASVRGQLLDAATGAVFAGEFTCELRAYSDAHLPTYPVGVKQSFRDAQGNFCLEGVQVGEFVVEAWSDGYARTPSENFIVWRGEPVQSVIVRMSKGRSIRGRIVDPEGRPIAKAHVVAMLDDGWGGAFTGTQPPFDSTRWEARTSSDGTFQLLNLGPSKYQLVIEAQGFARSGVPAIDVLANADVNQGELVLVRGGTLSGKIADAAGNAVPGAAVELFSGEDRFPRPERFRKADAKGAYKISNIAPGRYWVRAHGRVDAAALPMTEVSIGCEPEREVSIFEGRETKLDLTL